MRLFIAIQVSEEIRRALAEAQERLRSTGADLKLVEPENIHLTMKFLGEVAEEKVGEISGAMERAISGRGAFHARVRGVGVFPDMRYIRVVWAGVSEGSERIVELQRSLDSELQGLGFPRERDFVPHVTLARVRSPRGKEELAREIRGMAGLEFGEMEVKSVDLVQSRLTPKGPVYSTLAEVGL